MSHCDSVNSGLIRKSPPGSGKTKTIVAIVGAILTDTFRDRGIAIPIPQTKVGPERPSLSSLASKKLLVCAPSNAAVDELVMRLKQGVKTMRGEYHKLSIVRLGRSDAINASVMDVTLDELVNAKINPSSGKKTQQGEDIHDVMMEHKATSTELSIVRARLDESKAKGQAATPEQEREFDLLKRRKNQLGAKIDAARDSGNTAARDAEINRRRIQQEILNDAHVICATLSGSGHEMFQNLSIEFETVIIDEAAQSIELSALIPLKYGCSKCIMVGDPKQLPPTVLSREAARFQYEQSLFVRMQNNHPNDVHLLDTQYRMHPEISLFPSKTFYDGKLLDGANMAQLRVQPWHECGILGPYRFFDVQGTHQSAPKGHSLINVAEIEVALQLFGRLLCDCRDFDFKGKVGIITPYKSQLRELRLRFAQKYGDTIFSTIDFNTTDAFQGRESDIIIFSCVRASSTKGIGFLADIRRMNVGLTRAKSSLWVLGNSQSLKGGEFWARLIQDAKCRDLYTGGDVLTMLRRPLLPSNSNPQGPTLTAAAQGRRISSADKSEDVEMMDVPAISHRTLSVQGHSSGKQSPTDRSMEDVDIGALRAQEQTLNNISYDFITRSAHPSGGGNGLDPNKSCRACGSFAHQTSECDHEKAKAASSVSCYRCGDTNHHKQQCTADRCLECGGFGHKVNCTSSSPLSRREREQVKRAEIKHQFSIQTSSERQRKKQLGDHDAKVPAVRPTRKTPPLEREGGRFDSKPWQDPYLKRKLGSSPPMRAPKGPAAMSTMSKVGNPASSSSKIRSNGNVSNHPEPVRVPSNKTSKAFGDTPTPNRSLTIDSGPMDYGNSNGVDGLPEPLPVAGNGPRLSLPPKPGSATIRPVSKKKDVDPFIRPKSKRPRP